MLGACRDREELPAACAGFDDALCGDGRCDVGEGLCCPGSSDCGPRTLSAALNHTCALDDEGTVWCWGSGVDGALGDSPPASCWEGLGCGTPFPIALDGVAVEVATGGRHSCARLDDGTVRCWGFGIAAGAADNLASVDPTPIPEINSAVHLAAGPEHSCAVDGDGDLWCWGSFRGDNGMHRIPVSGVRRVAIGGEWGTEYGTGPDGAFVHICAALDDGTVRCLENQRVDPLPVEGLDGVVDLAVGEQYPQFCAARVDGSVWCWGENRHQQCGGEGYDSMVETPRPVEGLSDAVAVTAGYHYSCAMRADGSVWCWGENHSGVLGPALEGTTGTPFRLEGVQDVTQLAAGHDHLCASRADGSRWCWGRSLEGQLGNGTPGHEPTAPGFAEQATALWVRGKRSCAQRSDASVVCWGGSSSWEPEEVPGFPQDAVLQPSSEVLCALTAEGKAWCLDTSGSTEATEIQPSLSMRSIDAGGHSCAVLLDGSLRCWGHNYFGQLGDGTTDATTTPQLPVGLPGTSEVAEVAVGDSHTCVVLTDGEVWCWGADELGQLGDGGGEDSPIPRRVTGIPDAVSVTADRDRTCVLLSDHSLWCWGVENRYSDAPASPPTPITSNVSLSSADGRCVLLLSGDLGLTCAETHLPADVLQLGRGDSHACALDVDGTVWCWGSNAYYALGPSNPGYSPIPLPVLPF